MGNKLPDDLHYEIINKISTIGYSDTGNPKELNIISWNGYSPKMDIRTWNKSGTRPGKGVTLTEKEVNDLIQTYLIWKAENKSIVKASCEKVSSTNKYILHKVLLVMDRVYEGMKTELTVTTWSGQNAAYDLRPWKKNHVKYDNGITFSEEEMECFVKTLISYRDGTKLPIFDSSKIYKTSDDEKMKAMIFRTPDNKEKIEVIITWKAGDMTSEILTYAGSENLVRFVPKSLAEECCKTARNICSKSFDKEEQKKDLYPDLIKLKEKSFAEKIKICRTSHGYSKEEVADCIGVSHSTFGRWESGYTKVPAPKNIKSVKELAELFEVPYEWLVYGLGLISPVEKDLKAIFDSVSGVAKSDKKDTKKTPVIENKEKDLPISDLRELLPEEEAAPEKDKADGDFMTEIEKLAAKADDEFISEKPDQKNKAILFVPAKEEREDEKILACINKCITSLSYSGLSPNDMKNVHRILSDIRSELENRLLFGSSVSDSVWGKDSAAKLEGINNAIMALPSLGMDRDQKSAVYKILDDKRRRLESLMFGVSA